MTSQGLLASAISTGLSCSISVPVMVCGRDLSATLAVMSAGGLEMGLLDRVRMTTQPGPAGREARRGPVDPMAGPMLLERARERYERAEQDYDRRPETKAELEAMYAAAAKALAAGGHPDEAEAWFGLAQARRYQKGRRTDTLAAFDRAIAANPQNDTVWDAYLEYITYGISLQDLLALTERIPPVVRPRHLSTLLSVADGRDRWGGMPSADGARYRAELLLLLAHLGDQESLGLLLSENGLAEERNGSHAQAMQILRDAVRTGHPTVKAVDRLTVRLVKDSQWEEATQALSLALSGPIASDSMREKLIKRLARCHKQLGSPANESDDQHDTTDTVDDGQQQPAPRIPIRCLIAGQNTPIQDGRWTIAVGWRDPAGRFDVDASALLLASAGKIRSETDFIFYNQRSTPDRTVVHHGEQASGVGDEVQEQLTINLADLPADIVRIVVAASIDRGDFSGVDDLHLRAEHLDQSQAANTETAAPVRFSLPQLTVERAVLLAEIYRREHGWRIRAIGQGYADGLAGIARDFGVQV